MLTGTLPDLCHADAMARFLGARQSRLFDYPRFAEPYREELRAHAEHLAQAPGLTIEFIRRRPFRKEDRIKTILADRGDPPGRVPIFSARESCPWFKPWHDKGSGKTFLRSTEAKCLHSYCSCIDPAWGRCYLRVPTWAPFRLQFYCHGHSVLARELAKRKIASTLLDNACVEGADGARAQALADAWEPHRLHRQLDRLAATSCPVLRHFPAGVHWSCMQGEDAPDGVFHHQAEFPPRYAALTPTAIHAVTPAHVAPFLGRKRTGRDQDELGTDCSTRIQGTRIQPHLGWAAIKLYDQFGLIARGECTANAVTFFQHHRTVEHRDGTTELTLAPVRQSIHSLPVLRALLGAATQRYLDFLAAIEDPRPGLRALEKLATPVPEGERSYRGFNLFHGPDLDLFRTILRGEFTSSGFQARQLRPPLGGLSGAHLSRLLQRLRTHGLITKVGKRYKYYLTALGRTVAASALKLRELVIIPMLNQPVSA